MAHYEIQSPPDLWAKFAQSVTEAENARRSRELQDEQMRINKELADAQIEALNQKVATSKAQLKASTLNQALALLYKGMDPNNVKIALGQLGASADEIQQLSPLLDDPSIAAISQADADIRALKVKQLKSTIDQASELVEHEKNLDKNAKIALALQATKNAMDYKNMAAKNSIAADSVAEKKRMDSMYIKLGTARAILNYNLGLAEASMRGFRSGGKFTAPNMYIEKALASINSAKKVLSQARSSGIITSDQEKAIAQGYTSDTLQGLRSIGIYAKQNPKMPFLGKVANSAKKLVHEVNGITESVAGVGQEAYGRAMHIPAITVVGGMLQNAASKQRAEAQQIGATLAANNGKLVLDPSTMAEYNSHLQSTAAPSFISPSTPLSDLLDSIGTFHTGVLSQSQNLAPNTVGSNNGNK